MRGVVLLRLCAALSFLAVIAWLSWKIGTAAEKAPLPAAPDGSTEIIALKAEVERLKGMVPDQAHAMKDFGHHFSNLWFAGQEQNWPLAEFFWSETRSHMRWAVRIIPVRKDLEGKEIRLAEILDPIEATRLEDVGKAI